MIEKPENRKFYRKISAFICVHLRLISVSLRYRTQELKFKLFQSMENGSAPVSSGIFRGR